MWGGDKGSVRAPVGVHTRLGLYHQRSHSLVDCACGFGIKCPSLASNSQHAMRECRRGTGGLLSSPWRLSVPQCGLSAFGSCIVTTQSFHGALGLGWGESLWGGSWGDGLQANEATWWLVLPGLGRGEAGGCPLNTEAACLGGCRPRGPSPASLFFPLSLEKLPARLLVGASSIRQ